MALGFFWVSFVLAALGLRVIERVSFHQPPAPSPEEYYLASVENADHAVPYHGWLGTGRAMRSAKLLILGNSRTMFVFRREWTRRLCDELGLPFFALGFSLSEGHAFPLATVRKHDLRPEWIVVDVSDFFDSRLSGGAQTAMALSGFSAFKMTLETNAHFLVSRHLHQIVPRLSHSSQARARSRFYRSTRDGTWVFPGLDGVSTFLPMTEAREIGGTPKAIEIENARRFKAEVETRGSKLIFVSVPVPNRSPEKARRLAEAIEVPFIHADLSGLGTIDGSHLEWNSAKRYFSAIEPGLRRALAERNLASRGEHAK